jgi:hypothetical protein
LTPWLELRRSLPVGALFCVMRGASRDRPCAPAAIRAQLHRPALTAGVRRRFAQHHQADTLVVPTPTRKRPRTGRWSHLDRHNASGLDSSFSFPYRRTTSCSRETMSLRLTYGRATSKSRQQTYPCTLTCRQKPRAIGCADLLDERLSSYRLPVALMSRSCPSTEPLNMPTGSDRLIALSGNFSHSSA